MVFQPLLITVHLIVSYSPAWDSTVSDIHALIKNICSF